MLLDSLRVRKKKRDIPALLSQTEVCDKDKLRGKTAACWQAISATQNLKQG